MNAGGGPDRDLLGYPDRHANSLPGMTSMNGLLQLVVEEWILSLWLQPEGTSKARS